MISISKKNLSSLRVEIAKNDEDITKLVKKRNELARDIGAIKRQLKLPVRDYKVEKEVIQRFHKNCKKLGLDSELGEELAKLLIRYSIKAQLEDEK